MEAISLSISNNLNHHFKSILKNREFNFIQRLARENNWSLNYAHRCFIEYLRFIELIYTYKTVCTPSDEVDQVWHLHMQYSRHYQEMGNILGKFLHHDPTSGGQSENAKYEDQYFKTKCLYLKHFKENPPEDIWDDAESRFNIKPKSARINLCNKIILDKKQLYIFIIGFFLIGLGIGLIFTKIK